MADKKLTKDELRELRRQEWKQEAEKKAKEDKVKKYGMWSVIALVIVAVGFIFYKAASTPTTSPQSIVDMPKVEAKDIQTGPENAKVTLVEYSDFQCPTCALYHPIVKQLEEEYKGKVNFIYRMFPLSGHVNAEPAAQAAYAARLQGKFWEMEDALFTKQNEWATLADPKQSFVEYAKQLNLDVAKFEADYDSETVKKEVARQRDSALTIGIQGTPTFFVNGKMIQNPQGLDAFKKVLDEALK